MDFSEIIMLKIVAIILCDSIIIRIIIIGLVIFDFIQKQKKFQNIKFDNLFIGALILILNSILNINLIITNFVVLGVASSILKFCKIEKFLTIYLLFVSFEGVWMFCSSLLQI